MGDVLSLIERAQDAIGQDEVAELGRRMKAKQFDLNDMFTQLRQVQKMGSINDLINMIPGLGGIKRQLQGAELDDSFFRRAEAVYLSMTPEERKYPDTINGSRRRRIAAGSGTTPQDVNQLLKQWKEAKKMMQSMASGKMARMLGIR
jgi:signal recognition particle subunit SRP54